ncbi:MAG: hypothetical protein L3J82_06445 [Planctomycetes bacterium]|nr:hypothetical protein [Planctomycetota bacterium]
MALLIVESIPYLAFTGAALLIGFVVWDVLRNRKKNALPMIALPGDSGLAGKPIALPKSVTAASARLEIAVMKKEKEVREEAANSALLVKTEEAEAAPVVIINDENSETEVKSEEVETAAFEIVIGLAPEVEQKKKDATEEVAEVAEVTGEKEESKPEVSVNQATDMSEKQEAIDVVVREESGREYTCTDVVVQKDSSVRVFDTSLNQS